MVVSAVNNEILEIAARKIRQLSEKNLALKKFSEQMKIQEAASRLANARGLIKSRANIDNMQGCSSSASCIGKSVIDILMRRPKLFTFKEACKILAHCNINQDIEFIADTIRKYAIVIIGLPECASEDLPLAAFFFIEEIFGIQTKIELCVKITEEYETHAIGVVFDNIVTKQQITGMLRLLDGTDIEIDTYFDINWIVDGLCAE